MKGGTPCTKFALARHGALGGFRIVSEKWTDQCEDCSLKKKQDRNVPSRRHILGSKIFKEQLLEMFGKIFFPKVFGKKSRTMPKNLKRGHLGSFNVFYKPKTSKNARGLPFDKIRKFLKKVA